jgi:hypothetical protein
MAIAAVNSSVHNRFILERRINSSDRLKDNRRNALDERWKIAAKIRQSSAN